MNTVTIKDLEKRLWNTADEQYMVEVLKPTEGKILDIITTKTIQFNYPILKAS